MKVKRPFWVRVKGFVVRCLGMLYPHGYAIVPTEATPEMLDIEFCGDLGSGVPGYHKYLRADEYYFSRREQALAWGAQLYREMVRAHNAESEVLNERSGGTIVVDPVVGPFCCQAWKKARTERTDNEGAFQLLWVEDEMYAGNDRDTVRVGNIGHDTELPPVQFCPWCGHDWSNDKDHQHE